MASRRPLVYFVGIACAATLVLRAGAQGCVGTPAGIPLHPATDGSSAVGANMLGLVGALVDPTEACNLFLVLADRILLADCNRTLTRIAGGNPGITSFASIAVDAALDYPYAAVVPSGGGLVVVDSNSIQRLDAEAGQLRILGGNTSVGATWAPDGSLARGSRVR